MDGVARSLDELTPHEVGVLGEQACARMLERGGCEVVERNWRCPAGEVDLIVRDAGEVVLVEVKTRLCLGQERPAPEVAVDADKLARYRSLATSYLALNPGVPSIRFDVAGVTLTEGRIASIRYLRNVWLGDE